MIAQQSDASCIEEPGHRVFIRSETTEFDVIAACEDLLQSLRFNTGGQRFLPEDLRRFGGGEAGAVDGGVVSHILAKNGRHRFGTAQSIAASQFRLIQGG